MENTDVHKLNGSEPSYGAKSPYAVTTPTSSNLEGHSYTTFASQPSQVSVYFKSSSVCAHLNIVFSLVCGNVQLVWLG